MQQLYTMMRCYFVQEKGYNAQVTAVASYFFSVNHSSFYERFMLRKKAVCHPGKSRFVSDLLGFVPERLFYFGRTLKL